jgi:hypothetical protein
MMTLSRDGTKLFSPWAASARELMQGDERGSGRIMQELSKLDSFYIWVKIYRYNELTQLLNTATSEQTARFYQCQREAALWKIADRAKLFNDLPPVGFLTDDQWNQVINFVEQFQGGQHQ